MTPQEVIAEAIHDLFGENGGEASEADIVETILDALHANGHVVVQLPEPDEDGIWPVRGDLVWVEEPHVVTDLYVLAPDEARGYAAALLAAADLAEEQSS